MTDVIIRDMLPEDADAKGSVHYQSWQESYRGIIDEGYLAGMSEEKCQEIARRWPENTAVAAIGGRVIGFVCWCVCARDGDHSEETGEIVALYVLDEYKGRGIGRALTDYAMDRLDGCSQVILWVLKENHSAIGFYEHCGFTHTGEEKLLKLGVPTACICMAKKV